MVSEHELDQFHDVELDGWRRLAAGYAQQLAQLMSQATEPLLDAAAFAAESHVLDLCCGPGHVSDAIARRGSTPLGIDFAPEMIVLARQKWPGLAFEVGDAENLAEPDQSCDAAVMNFGLLHLARPEAALRHIARVLKPGGRLLSLDFNRPENAIVRAAYLGYLGLVGSTLGWILHRDPDTYRYIPASIRRYPGARGVADRLTARGFDFVTVIPLLFGLMSLHLGTLSSGGPSGHGFDDRDNGPVANSR